MEMTASETTLLAERVASGPGSRRARKRSTWLRRRAGGRRPAAGAGSGHERPQPSGHPATRRGRLPRAADAQAVQPDDVPQRGGLRPADHRPLDPVHQSVRAPPAAVHRCRIGRVPAARADPRAFEAGSCGRELRPRPPAAGADDVPDRRRGSTSSCRRRASACCWRRSTCA